MAASILAIQGTAGTVAVLSVSPIPEDHLALEHILTGAAQDSCRQPEWQVTGTATLSSALSRLRQVRYPVVLCERELPLGDWRDLLEHSRRLSEPPYVIVTARHADEYLWAEALNLGAYDVLAKPFYPNEVVRVVGMACLRWHRERRLAAPTKIVKQMVIV